MKSRYVAWIVIAIIITITIVIITNTLSAPPIADLEPGMSAPSIQLKTVRGDIVSSSDLHSQALLVSFINTQSDPTAKNADPSRSQVVFLRSMQEQYSGKGVKIMIVDASHLLTGDQISTNELLNFTYDWSLGDGIMVLMDDADSKTAKQYGVFQLPTTFLIDSKHQVIQRWDGYTSASQLAFALQELVGAPVHRDENFPIQPAEANTGIQCNQETPAQAKFAGLGLARGFSDQIWVIDGGQQWGVGGAWPLQWIILANGEKSKDHDLHLSVTIQNIETDEHDLLVNEMVHLMPPDESAGLLAGFADPKPNVYLLTQAVHLENPGCYQLVATVTREDENAPLYTGIGLIQVGK